MLEFLIPENATRDMKLNRYGKTLLIILSSLTLILERLTQEALIPEEYQGYLALIGLIIYGLIDITQKLIEKR